MNYTAEYWHDVDRIIDHCPVINELNGKSVLITGVTGLICSAVADVLLRAGNCKLYFAGRSPERIEKRFQGFREGKNFVYVPFDATEHNQLDICADYVIHGASNAHPAVYSKQPVETMLANFLGLNDLLNMAVQAKSKRLLYISSSEIYGNNDGFKPYKEDDFGYLDILNPRSSYPSAKRAAETLCIAYKEEFGLETVIVRPGHIYGPTITDKDSRASAQFTRSAVAGEKIVMKSAGTQLRSYCYVLDCASAVLTVLTRGESGQAYNISNPDSIVTISELARALAKVADTEVVFQDASREEMKGYSSMSNSSLDSTKLEKLGWRALFDIEEGAHRTVQILRAAESV